MRIVSMFALSTLLLLSGIVLAQNTTTSEWRILDIDETARITGQGCAICYNVCDGDGGEKARCKGGFSGTCGIETISTQGGSAYICGSWGTVDNVTCQMSNATNACTVYVYNCVETNCIQDNTSSNMNEPATCNMV